MSTPEPAPILPPGVRLDKLLPKSTRQRHALLEWNVCFDGKRIGRIEQWQARGAASTFYRAKAFHPATGKVIELESDTDLAERVAKVLAAWRDPERFVHKPSWEQTP